MPTYVRKPQLIVSILTKASSYSHTWGISPISASTQVGFDQQLRQATVTVRGNADLPKLGDKITISMGDDVGSTVVRFYGYVAEFDYTLYPISIGVICTGPLQKALTYQQPAGNGVSLCSSPIGAANFTDNTGQTDTAIVNYILQTCGCPYSSTTVDGFTASISGLGRTYGTVATKQTRWNEGETALAAIQKIDQVSLGYRTYETANSIKRSLISTVPSGNALVTFTEGVDILEGSSSLSILNSYYQVLISGFNSNKHNGSNIIWKEVTQSNTSNIPWATNAHLSNSLIEFINTADITGSVGVACQEVGTWLLGEYNRVIYRATFTVLTDPVAASTGTLGLEPGNVIQLTSPNRLGINTTMWVQNVTTTIDERGAFSQKIVALVGGNA